MISSEALPWTDEARLGICKEKLTLDFIGNAPPYLLDQSDTDPPRWISDNDYFVKLDPFAKLRGK